LSLKPFEDIEIHVIELPKIEKYQHSTNKDLYAWLKFLSNPESEEVKMSKKDNENLKEAYSRLEFISGDIDLQRQADLQLMAIMDERSKNDYYVEKDKEFAEKEKKFEELQEKEKKILEDKQRIIKKMYEKGMSIEEIEEITGYSKEEIENTIK